jgi:hypothetical protein
MRETAEFALSRARAHYFGQYKYQIFGWRLLRGMSGDATTVEGGKTKNLRHPSGVGP